MSQVKPIEPMTDEQRQLAESSEWIVGWWMKSYGSWMVRHHGYHCDDLRQECRKALYLAIQRNRPGNGDLKSFLCKSVKLEMRTYFTFRKGELIRSGIENGNRVFPNVSGLGDDYDVIDRSPSEQEIPEKIHHLLDALSKLPNLNRIAIDLRFGLTDRIERADAEVAKIMGIPRRRVIAILKTGRSQLKRLLATSRSGG